MIREKIFSCSLENPEAVILEIAEEIKAGWRINEIERLPVEINCNARLKPAFNIHLVRKEK